MSEKTENLVQAADAPDAGKGDAETKTPGGQKDAAAGGGRDSTAELGTAPVGKLLLKLAIPTVVAQLVNLAYNMVDRIYIGHIPEVGATALTGVGVSMSLIMLISAFAMLIGAGGAPKATIFMGKGDREGAEKILGNCTALMVILSVALTVFFQVFGRRLLLAFGASSQTIVYAWGYFRIYALGTLFVQTALGLNMFITSQGFSRISMMTVMIGAVCNIILDPIFIFALGMGVQGAATATVISQGISAVWVLRFLTGEKTNLRIRRGNLLLKRNVILPCIALGLSPFIMNSTESLLTICFNSSLQKYGGDMAVGAMTILSTVMQFSMMPLAGMTQGAQPIVGFNYGAGNKDRVKKAFRLLLSVCVIYSTTIWCVSVFAPGVFAGLFTADAALLGFTKSVLPVYMAASLLMGVQLACQQTFIALDQPVASLIMALLRKIILLIPLIFILPRIMENKVFAVYLAEPVADFIAVTVTAVTFFFVFRRLMREEPSA